MLGGTMAGLGAEPFTPALACDPCGMGMGTGVAYDPLGTSMLGAGMGGCCAAPAVVAKPGLLARLCAGIDLDLLRRPNMCKGISAAAAFFWFVVWVISIISTSIPDWWWWVDSTSGVHEGLWSTCWAHYCIPSNGYSDGCMSLLRVVRAFSVMTIIFGFFNFVMSMMLFCCITRVLYPALLCGFLTWVFALITWAVYLGFKGQCVMGSQFFIPSGYPYYYSTPSKVGVSVTLGSGWCLAVAAFPLALFAHFLDIAWCILCRNRCGPACPCPCPCPAPCPPVDFCACPAMDPCLAAGSPLTFAMEAPACPCPAPTPIGGATYTVQAPTYSAAC